ncbi:MAG: PAS domain S-box protein, partial [Chloroflexota bacterium]
DLILADYNLPDFDGIRALKLFQKYDIDIPFILVSGIVGEETAIESLKAGATDYVLKDRLSRLGLVVKRALQEQEERRRLHLAEKELRKLSQAVEQSSSLVMITDTEGIIEYINPQFAEVTGYTLDEIRGLTPRILKSGYTSEMEYQTLWEVIVSGQEWQGEFYNKKKNGDFYWTSAMISPIKNEDGETTHYLAVEEDISQRKEAEDALRRSEAYFRSLIGNISDIITLIDAEGIIQYESPSITRVLGYQPNELVGENVFDFIHPDDRKSARNQLEQGLNYAVEEPSIELRIRHKDGSWHILEAIGNNLLDDPVIAGIVVNSRDVTERRQLEAQLRFAQKMEAVGQLTAGIAHDFNNLLTAINGFSELMLLKLSSDDPLYPMAGKISNAGQRAENLVRQLLTFSRKQIVEPTVLNLNEVVSQIDNMLRRIIGEHIDLKTQLDENLRPVKADPSQIEQIIVNLAVNARDAMPDGGELIIQTANVTDPMSQSNQAETREQVVLMVKDTGIGMGQDVQARIFEPFFTTKPAGQGTGLGLATVYGIVKQSGGDIQVESTEEEGTLFKIFFPSVTDEVVPQQLLKVSEDIPLGKETILLVEDEEGVRDLVSTVLQAQGYRVLDAQNGQVALQLMTSYEGQVHLLLTDVVMPNMSGKTLAQQLSLSYPQLKVLYMSGYTDDAISNRGLEQTKIALLQKPFTSKDLAQKVRQVLDSITP